MKQTLRYVPPPLTHVGHQASALCSATCGLQLYFCTLLLTLLAFHHFIGVFLCDKRQSYSRVHDIPVSLFVALQPWKQADEIGQTYCCISLLSPLCPVEPPQTLGDCFQTRSLSRI